MRETKFRAWDKAYKKMIADFLVERNRLAISFKGEIFSFTDWESVNYEPERMRHNSNYPDRFVLMQYTGLKDRNDTEIYEGDILGGIIGHGIVYWDKDRAGFGINCNGELDEVRFEELSKRDLWVIGNIYQDPELLEVK